MNTETKIFLGKKFKAYYWKNRTPAPPEIEMREFGFGTLETKIKARHRAFRNSDELQNFLKREAPFYISYSSAYYEFPENQPMSSKNWLGAALVFDLDMLMEFLNSGKMDSVKNEALNLIEFLENDFGFSKKDIEVNFSGSKGYHLRIRNESIRDLGRDERREIVDYVSGNINFMDYLRVEEDTSAKGGGVSIVKGPTKGNSGWARRIYSGLYNFINDSSIEEMETVKGIGEKKAREVYENRERILNELEQGRYSYIPEILTVDKSSSKTNIPNITDIRIKNFNSPLINKIIHEKSIKTLAAEDADKMVTIDTARLMRLPESLHGGSGLKASIVKDLDEFNPLVNSIAFSDDEIEIGLNKKIPKFDFNENRFGPFSGKVRVPEYCAVYLLLKGCGEVVE